MLRGLLLLIAFVTLPAAGQVPTLPRFALQDLTVPPDRLPEGCALTPPNERLDGNRIRGVWAGLPVPTNPWAGPDKRIIATIRQVADPSPPLPDALRSMREARRYSLLLAEGVEEGYAAIYSQSGSSRLLVVYALRLAEGESPLHRWSAARAEDPGVVRIENGSVLVVASGDPSPCFDAIRDYLNALMK
jgi:hypothetical protein